MTLDCDALLGRAALFDVLPPAGLPPVCSGRGGRLLAVPPQQPRSDQLLEQEPRVHRTLGPVGKAASAAAAALGIAGSTLDGGETIPVVWVVSTSATRRDTPYATRHDIE